MFGSSSWLNDKLKCYIFPLYNGGIMGEVQLKVDSKGRLYIPPDIREQIGDIVTLKRTKEGFLIAPGKPRNFMEEFLKVITSEPLRTGKPENWPPSKMKAVWSKA
jgi:bifunctional DNA-binding transcriptional regulator/antitoxin component of YhaV-PrlF toxin-antitoxin module